MITSKNIHGIVPSDVIIRTAIIAAIEDVRNNPFLLDYVFNWLSSDSLTAQMYGEDEKARAKKWFLNTDISVAMNFRTDDPKFPMIAITLQSSSEDNATLGDVNYETYEDVDSSEFGVSIDPVLGPFSPSYDQLTGKVTLPAGLTTDNVFVNQILFSTVAKEGFVITDVIDSSTFTIQSGLSIDFTDAFVTPIDSFYVTSIESVAFKEIYQLKCFAQGDPVNLLYLHTLLTFIYYRYKQEFLEKRGFDRSTLSSGPVYTHQLPQSPNEMIFARDVTLSGYCRQYWPKMISPKIQGVKINGVQIVSGSTIPSNMLLSGSPDGWFTVNDTYTAVTDSANS